MSQGHALSAQSPMELMVAGSENAWAMANSPLEELQSRYEGPDTIPEPGTTTLMIRNLPRSYTAEAVILEVQFHCLRTDCDFVYLPWDTRRSSNISYAFLNFVNHEACMRAFFALSGQTWYLVRSQKMCGIAAAHVQGLAENIANYVATVGIQDGIARAPIVFHNGVRMDVRDAVNLFCTGEMLQRAARAAQGPQPQLSEGSHSQAPVDPSFQSFTAPTSSAASAQVSSASASPPQPRNGSPKEERTVITPAQSARAFRETFNLFCQYIAAGHASCEVVGPALEQEDDPDLTFWAGFRDVCVQFPDSLPELMNLVPTPSPASSPLTPSTPLWQSEGTSSAFANGWPLDQHAPLPRGGYATGFLGRTLPEAQLPPVAAPTSLPSQPPGQYPQQWPQRGKGHVARARNGPACSTDAVGSAISPWSSRGAVTDGSWPQPCRINSNRGSGGDTTAAHLGWLRL